MDGHETHTTRRGVRIFKNPRISKTDWIRRITNHGRQVYFRLGNNRREAAKAADELDAFLLLPETTIEAALERFDSRHAQRKRPNEFPTIGDVLDIHRKHFRSLEIRKETARNYRNSICYVIRIAMAYRGGKKPSGHSGERRRRLPEEEYSLDILKPDLFEDFQDGMTAGAGRDMRAGQTARRNANAYMARAKALFSNEAIDLYRNHGLQIPDMGWLRSVRKFRRVDRGARYVLPPEEVIIHLLEGIVKLPPELLKMALLGIHAGLRREEALQARRAWLLLGSPEVLHLQTEPSFLSKNALSRAIELSSGVGVLLDELSGAKYILSGTAFEREATARALVQWLRQNGLDRRLPFHELRKLFGAIVASTRGIYPAQRQLGHLSPQVTSDSYSDVVVSERIISAWRAMPLST